MTEETHNAAMSGPIGIVTAIGVSAVLGWFLILSLLFSIQDYETTVASTAGQPVTQIFLDTVGKKGAIVLMASNVSIENIVIKKSCRLLAGNHHWSDVLLWVRPGPSPSQSVFTFVLCRCMLHRTFSVTSNSRMMFAFSRDGAIPGSKFLHKVDYRWRSPIRTGSSFSA
jgi:amino acid transporter